MAEKKSGAVRIDWDKKEAQFSPNIKLTSKKIQNISNDKQIKETIIRFEIISNKIENSECQTYSFEIDKISENKPLNINNPWYFDFTGDVFITENAKTPPRAPSKEKVPEQTYATKKSIISPQIEIDEDEIVKPSSLFATGSKPELNVKSTPEPPKIPPHRCGGEPRPRCRRAIGPATTVLGGKSTRSAAAQQGIATRRGEYHPGLRSPAFLLS